MPYTLTITAETHDDLVAQIERLLHVPNGMQVLTPEDERAIKAARSQKADDDDARQKLQDERDKPTVGKAAAKSKPKASKAEPEPKASKAEPKAEEPPAEEPKVEAALLDFDKDVAPIVVRLVTEKGRDVTQGLLDEYGVARASQISDDLLPEFLEKVKEALAS